MCRKRLTPDGRKENKFFSINSFFEKLLIEFAAKTDCLLVRGDSNTFFSDSSITQYFGSPSGNGF